MGQGIEGGRKEHPPWTPSAHRHSTTGKGRREETGAAKACSTRPWGPQQLLTGQAQGVGPKPQKPAAGGAHVQEEGPGKPLSQSCGCGQKGQPTPALRTAGDPPTQ